jgi:hypothetical protein
MNSGSFPLFSREKNAERKRKRKRGSEKTERE